MNHGGIHKDATEYSGISEEFMIFDRSESVAVLYEQARRLFALSRPEFKLLYKDIPLDASPHQARRTRKARDFGPRRCTPSTGASAGVFVKVSRSVIPTKRGNSIKATTKEQEALRHRKRSASAAANAKDERATRYRTRSRTFSSDAEDEAQFNTVRTQKRILSIPTASPRFGFSSTCLDLDITATQKNDPKKKFVERNLPMSTKQGKDNPASCGSSCLAIVNSEIIITGEEKCENDKEQATAVGVDDPILYCLACMEYFPASETVTLHVVAPIATDKMVEQRRTCPWALLAVLVKLILSVVSNWLRKLSLLSSVSRRENEESASLLLRRASDNRTESIKASASSSWTQDRSRAHGHILCQDCVVHFVMAHRKSPPPIRCCYSGCSQEILPQEIAIALGRGDVQKGLQHPVYHEIQDWQRDYVIQTLNPQNFVRCPSPDCTWAVARDPQGPAKRVTCPICPNQGTSFCSSCGDIYHYQTTCAEWHRIQRRWQEWLDCGKSQYWKKSDESRAKARWAAQREHNRIQYVRNVERVDEQYKASNCRHCPHCNRLVERIEGCSIMYCGLDTDTKGNHQAGCKQKFNWNEARAYQPVAIGQHIQTNAPSRILTESSKDKFHHVNDICDHCGSTDVRGLLFECANCPRYRICEQCERQEVYRQYHDKAHVFAIHKETWFNC